MLLAAIGIYGVTAYMVTSRTREIGIRMALGARKGAVVHLVLRQGMMLTVAGAAIGLLLAAGASRLLGSLLFGVGATDPLTFIGAAALFCRDRPGGMLWARAPGDRNRCDGGPPLRVIYG